MKPTFLFFTASLITQVAAFSQTTAAPAVDAPPAIVVKEAPDAVLTPTTPAAVPVVDVPPGTVIEKKTITTTTTRPGEAVETRINIPGPRAILRKLDNLVVRRQLSVAPRTRPIVERVVITPPATTEVTTTRTIVPGRQVRVYDPERNVVVVQGEKEDQELPYVALPVLFTVAKDELLDEESAEAIRETAVAIKEIAKTEPNALFDVEGHTSVEGTDEMNLELSAKRAKKVLYELTARYGVDANLLTAHGYGENYPNFPNGTEEQLEKDRRVLVVRTR